MRTTHLLSFLAAATYGVLADGTTGSSWTYPYPYPVQNHLFPSQRQILAQAYMDIKPNGTANNQTIMLLHGKNFCGATWVGSIQALSAAGYRVIAPDQIGFCKSSKPKGYQFTLSQLAHNTKGILDSLGITKLTVMGHSMGGMLATRFALLYPNITSKLVIVSPLGLEDWQSLGVPYNSIDNIYPGELAANYTSIRAYQQSTYYGGTWQPAYDVWVHMLVRLLNSTEGPDLAWNSAQVTDMVFTQPIAHEFEKLKPPTLLIVGDKDTTAIGKQWAPPDLAPKLGNYSALGPKVAAKIPNSTYVHWEDLGHSPQIQDPGRFHSALLDWLRK